MKYSRQIGSHVVVAECGEDLSDQANALLETLEQLDARGPPLHDGSVIEFGWSRLVLRGADSELLVGEPDFGGNPLRDSRPTVDDTLRVLRDQGWVTTSTSVEPLVAYFSNKAITYR